MGSFVLLFDPINPLEIQVIFLIKNRVFKKKESQKLNPSGKNQGPRVQFLARPLFIKTLLRIIITKAKKTKTKLKRCVKNPEAFVTPTSGIA